MKRTILLLLGIILLNFVSARTEVINPNDQPNWETWQEWAVTYTSDNDFFVQIADSRSKNTEICLLSDKATSINQIDTSKNVYDNKGAVIKSLYLGISPRSLKYGYCYNTTGEEYLKFGENSTIVQWVNQSGGSAYKGWSYFNYLFLGYGAPSYAYPTWTPYSSAEKNITSTYNSDYVAGQASGLGGADCVSRPQVTSLCSYITEDSETGTHCSDYWETSGTGKICQGVAEDTPCLATQPCNRYSAHKFYFNVTKTNAVNFSILAATMQGAYPGAATNVSLYLYNFSKAWYADNQYVFITSKICSYNTLCNITASTNSVNNFINSTGYIQYLIHGNQPWATNVYYADVEIGYNSCSYSGSGNWEINSLDNCYFSNAGFNTQNITIFGSGNLTFNNVTINCTGFDINSDGNRTATAMYGTKITGH